MSSDEMAVMAIGVCCKGSARYWAVTMISASPVSAGSAVDAVVWDHAAGAAVSVRTIAARPADPWALRAGQVARSNLIVMFPPLVAKQRCSARTSQHDRGPLN